MENLKDQFNKIAQEYDRQRPLFIPCFYDFYGVAVENLIFETDTPTIIDLGAGTGLFSEFILQKYPKANIILVDLSEKMLSVAETRFANKQNIQFCVADIVSFKYHYPVDAVVSSLAIHHLEDEDKQTLYKNIYKILKQNGLFIHAEQVEGATPYMRQLNHNKWVDKVESSGLSRSEIDAGYERVKLDKRVPLEVQLQWLRESGFKEVDCLYKYYDFTVMYCKK